MRLDIDEIRTRNPIVDLVGEKFSLKKSGSRFIGTEHDSMVVVPKTGFYFWNSRGEHGDVFDFVGRYHLNYGLGWNCRDAQQFIEAVEYLAHRAGITIERRDDFQRSPVWSERQFIQRLHDTLLKTPTALAYAQARGWDEQTIRVAKLGFMPADKRPLVEGLNLAEKWRHILAKFPPGMLVYVHREKGRLTYLSGRSIEGKRHYNPPRDIAGDKQPYRNHLYHEDAEQVVLVEGQADAITFGAWQIPAIAMAGMTVQEALLDALKQHPRVFIALDNTDEAQRKALEIAKQLPERAFLPQLPDGIKDANDWLAQHGATAEDAAKLLNNALSWLAAEVRRVGQLEGLARQDAVRELFAYAVSLDEFAFADFKTAAAQIGIKGREFTDLVKAARSQQAKESPPEDNVPEILNDDVPMLSPALGFRRDVAMLTVSVVERTRDNKLHIQPYLVTSKRELRRLTDEQVITVNNQEIALKTIPEGSEFLMRWRYGDIKRFLNSEAVQPGEVFATIHELLRRYIDFRSEIESKVLTLWTVGTYFYTMFPAYPYLALNGPKNSGKSTVMRVLQPLAFNMITTSDPTGPSLFRLIHHTACTVGIDEAERYHNPRDPGMQQIRQLLNSGYKQGMPAIRVTGEDFKPQAFDVYSPKILAAIMGLEDILASRCIAIPMRRSDQQLPSFPPDFDGAPIRHQLYTLALTHFEAVYRNYFERPELHTLNNRSAELWSPLVALAAFFEEQGSVEGLLAAICEAAEWDNQISEGKALSDREEAVLQALEDMTRHCERGLWIKAAELRERVRTIMGLTREQMGHAQWIGHVLNRLALTDRTRKRSYAGGQMYLIRRDEVSDMMQRYEIEALEEAAN